MTNKLRPAMHRAIVLRGYQAAWDFLKSFFIWQPDFLLSF